MAHALHLSAKEKVLGGHIPEILQSIFEPLVLDWETSECGSSADLQTRLRKINIVCRSWHEVASACPRLWRNIFNADIYPDDYVLSLQDSPGRDIRSYLVPDHHVPARHLFLKRAGAVPLRLHGVGVLPLLGLVKQLDASQRANVEQLRMEWDDDWLSDISAENHDTVRQRLRNMSLPNLKTLVLDVGLSFDIHYFTAFISRWSSIRSLILSRFAFPDASVQVAELTHTPTVFPNLEELQTIWSFLDDPNGVFCTMSLPKMRSLSFFLNLKMHGDYPENVLLVPNPGGRWGQWDSLRVIRVGGDILLGELRSLLLLAPYLQILELCEVSDCSDSGDGIDARGVFEMLMVIEEQPLCLPRLATLRVDKRMPQTSSVGSVPFDEFIASRLSSHLVSPLLEVGLEPGRPLWDECLARAVEFAGRVSIIEWHPKHYLVSKFWTRSK